MKKIWLLIVMLFLAACGSGGSSTPPAIVTKDTPTGRLAIKFAPEDDSSKALASFAPGKHFRIVVRNAALLLDDGKVFSLIQDGVPGDSIGFALPVANGYTVEALAFNTDPASGLNYVVKYAVTNSVRVTSTSTSTVTLALTPVTGRIVLPSSVVQGARYYVLASYSTALGRQITPLLSNWYLCKPQTTPFNTPSAPFTNKTSATVFASTHTFDAPKTLGIPTNLFFQAVFTIKPTLLRPEESTKQWVFNSTEASMPVTADTNVTVTLPGTF